MCICNFEYLPRLCLKFRLHIKFNSFPKIHFTGIGVLGREDESREGTYLETEKIQPNHIANKFCLLPAERYFNGKWCTVCQLLHIYVSFLDKMHLFRLELEKNFQFYRKKNPLKVLHSKLHLLKLIFSPLRKTCILLLLIE